MEGHSAPPYVWRVHFEDERQKQQPKPHGSGAMLEDVRLPPLAGPRTVQHEVTAAVFLASSYMSNTHLLWAGVLSDLFGLFRAPGYHVCSTGIPISSHSNVFWLPKRPTACCKICDTQYEALGDSMQTNSRPQTIVHLQRRTCASLVANAF